MLLVYLGLRKDELRRIPLADVDLEARTLIVQGKGGHVDTLPIGFEHVYNALAHATGNAMPTSERRAATSIQASTGSQKA
jgi:site-specific recombinase XerC